MCLILFAYKAVPDNRLIIAANRDEFFSRPTSPMHFWKTNPRIIAGTDLKAGGTWLGINENKKFAAITNYRDPLSTKKNPPSRGQIIKNYLDSNKNAAEFLDELNKKASSFNGFNLLLSDSHHLFWFSNRNKKAKKLKPGIYGLSNHLIDTPWPKVTIGKQALKELIYRKKKDLSPNDLFHILENKKIPKESELPDTGVGLKWEKILAPVFVNSPEYGTRSSSVIITSKDGHSLIGERGFDKNGDIQYERRFFL